MLLLPDSYTHTGTTATGAHPQSASNVLSVVAEANPIKAKTMIDTFIYVIWLIIFYYVSKSFTLPFYSKAVTLNGILSQS